MQPSSEDTTRKCRPRLEDNIKVVLTEVRCQCAYWIHVAQDRDHMFHVFLLSTTHDFI
jgi:hypothetical protein